MAKRRCTVPYCKTIYSKKKRITLFRVPTNRAKQWQEAMYGITLTSDDRICAKHFKEEHLIRIMKTNLYTYQMKIPRLTPDAVPSIFPAKFKKAYEKGIIDNLNEKEDLFPIDNYININDEEENPGASNNNQEHCIFIKNEEEDDSISGEPRNETNYSEDCIIVDNINQIFQRYVRPNVIQQNTIESNWLYDLSIGRISLPDTSWAIHSITNNDDPLALLPICLTKMIIKNDTPLTKFNIIITNNIIKFYIFNKQIQTMNVEAINSLNEFEDLICRICTIECCYGVELSLVPTNFKDPSFRIDPLLNQWRHISCNYVIDDNRYQMCSNCKKIFKVVYESGQGSSTTSNCMEIISDEGI